jgi:DNA-binding PadR family transcriptional regulator
VARKGAALEMAVLGLLHETPLHGYELRKRLNLLLGWTRLLSYGSLYPALKRMLREGVITDVTTPGTVSLRQRITYQITPAGREFFAREVTDDGPSAWEDESFNMRFAFFSRTSADVRLRILEGRRSRLQERLDRQRKAAGGDDRYLSELRRHSIESVEREVRWLTELINAERGVDGGSPETSNTKDTPTTRSAPNAPAATPAGETP